MNAIKRKRIRAMAQRLRTDASKLIAQANEIPPEILAPHVSQTVAAHMRRAAGALMRATAMRCERCDTLMLEKKNGARWCGTNCKMAASRARVKKRLAKLEEFAKERGFTTR